MDAFGTGELRNLMGQQADPCVSVYLPTHVSGEEGQQDPVRLKNLLKQAEAQLIDGGMPRCRCPRSHGLAIFIAAASAMAEEPNWRRSILRAGNDGIAGRPVSLAYSTFRYASRSAICSGEVFFSSPYGMSDMPVDVSDSMDLRATTSSAP